MPWYSAWHAVGLREMLNGLMNEWDGVRVVLETEKELEKSLRAPSCIEPVMMAMLSPRQHAVE